MKTKMLFAGILFSIGFTSTTLAKEEILTASNEYMQTIHIVNILANTNLPDPGMTKTAFMVEFYNDKSRCWWDIVSYQADYDFHAATGFGCSSKVNRIIITPQPVADKLLTYQGPLVVDIDTTKFSTQLIITQKDAPQFDPQSGLVATAGTMQPIKQSMR